MSEETLREAVLELVKRGLAALGPRESPCSGSRDEPLANI